MTGPAHRFPFEKHHVLDSAKRMREQPPGRLIELVLAGKPATVIDLGAGTGYFALPLARRLTAGGVIAIDADPRMLELIRARADEEGLTPRLVTIAAAAGEAPLPLDDATADAAFSVNLYHEIPHPAAALADLRRVLRPGGRLILSDWDPSGDPAQGGPRLAHRVPAGDAARTLEEAGWTGIRRIDLYTGTWTLAAITPGEAGP